MWSCEQPCFCKLEAHSLWILQQTWYLTRITRQSPGLTRVVVRKQKGHWSLSVSLRFTRCSCTVNTIRVKLVHIIFTSCGCFCSGHIYPPTAPLCAAETLAISSVSWFPLTCHHFMFFYDALKLYRTISPQIKRLLSWADVDLFVWSSEALQMIFGSFQTDGANKFSLLLIRTNKQSVSLWPPRGPLWS